MALSQQLPGSVVLSCLAGFLTVPDLCRIQATDSETKVLFEDPAAWRRCAGAALHSFELGAELFDKDRRAEFLALFRLLTGPHVRVQPKIQVPLETPADAKRLATILAAAQKTAAEHCANGGRFAEVAVVRLRFDAQTVQHVFDEPKGAASSSSQSQLCFGTSSVLRLAGGAVDSKRSLRLHLAMQGSTLLASARTDGAPPEAIPLLRDRVFLSPDEAAHHFPLTMDLSSLSPQLTLRYRAAEVHANLGWQTLSSGILQPFKGKVAARAALTDGVPCVVCLRDGSAGSAAGVAKALHLDNPFAR